MFTHIYIDNLEGISNLIELDFIAKSRNKESLKSVVRAKDGTYINKLVGIIGGNASGKTSIISAIALIGQVMVSPIMNFNVDERISKIREMLEAKDQNQEIISQMIDSINNSTDISVQNAARKEETTKIEVEMYIEDEKDELTGFYKYMIVFNGVSHKIVKEYFSYRETLKENEKVIIDIENSKQFQLYYINGFYKNITDLESEEEIKEEVKEKYKYIKVFVDHYIKNSAIIDTSEDTNYKKLSYINWFEKSPEFLKALIKIVDPKIKNIRIDGNMDKEKLLFVLKNNAEITRAQLSTGTQRFLNMIRYAIDIIEKNGVLVIDEVEQNMHKELVELIIRLFGELENKSSQIIFTTHAPEVFDFLDNEERRIFKQDAIFVINNKEDKINIEKLSKIEINGKRVKGDAIVQNLYRNRKISCHPDNEQMKEFFNKIRNK